MAAFTRSRSSGLTRGELAARSGSNIETIRYYERVGLMPPPPRTPGGHRVYGSGDLKRLYFICRGRRLGFSLNEIRELLALVDQQDFTCDAIRDLTLSHAREVQAKILDLQKIEHVLRDMAAQCDRGDLPDCPVLDTLFADSDAGEISQGIAHDNVRAPDLNL